MEKIYDITTDAPAVSAGAKEAASALAGLDKQVTRLSEAVQAAFSQEQLTNYTTAVKRLGKETADQLLVLRLGFGKLKASVMEAAAPLANQLLPGLNRMVRQATSVADTAGSFLRYLFTGSQQTQALADSAEEAAAGEKKLAAAVKSSGKAARGSLLSIDQLQRLNRASGSGRKTTADTTETATRAPAALSPELMALADRLRALIEPLRAIDLTALQTALGTLRDAFGNLASAAAGALEGLWYTVLVPFLSWVAEEFAPAFTQVWAAGMNLAAQVIEPVSAGIVALLGKLQPVAQFITTTVTAALAAFRGGFEQLGAVFAVHSPQITAILENIGTVLNAVWLRVEPVLSALRASFLQTFSAVGQIVNQVASAILTALYGVSEFLAGAFTGDWKRSWEGIKTWFAGLVNGIIGLLNGLLSRLGAAINAVVSAANRLHFTVPDWVPGLGGKVFGVHMARVSVPQIPYLAKGAVLPANKPFLAMVGDQRSGTNIEAPLATIQEAVRDVTGSQNAALAAACRDSVAVQRQILEAVLGIRIGDDVIGAAAQRYNHRQAMMTGGMV